MPYSSDPEAMKLALAVGQALTSWSGFELRLALLFERLSDMESTKANAVYDTIIAFETRLAICDAMMQLEPCEPLELATWKSFSGRVRKLHKKRHEVAHFCIITEMVPGGEKTRLAPFFSIGKVTAKKDRYLTFEQIKERAERFDALREGVMWFHHQVCRRRGLVEDIPQQLPSLIAHIQELLRQTPPKPVPPRRSSRG